MTNVGEIEVVDDAGLFAKIQPIEDLRNPEPELVVAEVVYATKIVLRQQEKPHLEET